MFSPNQFCRFNQIRGSPVLNCWPVACDDLAMGLGFMDLHGSCVQNRMRKHPWYRLTLSLLLSCFHSHQCQQFHHVSPMDIPTYYATGPLALSLTRAAKRLSPSSSRFLCVHSFLRDPKAFCLGTTADIRSDPFQYHFT